MNALQSLRPILRLFFYTKGMMLLAGIVTATVTVLAGIALLGLSGWFITATAIAGLSVSTAIVFDVFAPAAGIRLLAILRTGSRYLERLVTHDATLAILAAMREKLFRNWAGPQAASALMMRPARLLFRLTADIDALDSLYLRVVVPVGAALATALVAGLALGLMHPAFGLIVVLILLLAGLGLPLIAAKQSGKPMRRRAKGTEALRARTVDLVAGQTELLMSGRMAAQNLALIRADHYVAKADHALNRIEIRTGTGLGIAHAALLGFGLIGVGWLVKAEMIGAPVAALGMLIILGVMEPFSALRRGAMELGRTILAARRVGPQLETSIQTQALPQPPFGKALVLSGVNIRYEGAKVDSLHAVDLTVRQGERIAIIGTSGAGKSTLFNVLAGEMGAHTGQVAVLPATLLTQRIELFQDSLRDNLRLADPEASDDALMQALSTAGLDDFVANLPQGLNSMLGEGGLGLSGGQARRLALARLFLGSAQLWLMDEPTEGLDETTARDVLARIMTRLGSHTEKRTLLIATHIRREAEICDRLIVFDQGALIESVARYQPRFAAILANLR